MWPVQSANKELSHRWSMPRPAKLQSEYKKKDQVVSECSEKNCQDNKCANMWPVKPEMNMWSKEPQSSFKKKHVPLCSDKNCQSTRCYRKRSPMRPMCAKGKNCQSKPRSIMQSVAKSSIIQLPKPAMEQSTHKNGSRCFSSHAIVHILLFYCSTNIFTMFCII